METTKLNKAYQVIQRALKKNLILRVKDLPWGNGTEVILGIKEFKDHKKIKKFLELPNKVMLDLETSLYRIQVQDIYDRWYPLFHRGVYDDLYTVNWVESDHEQYLHIHFDNCREGNFLSNTEGQFLGVIRDTFVDTIEHKYDLWVSTTPNNPKAELIELKPEHIIYSILTTCGL